MSKAYEECHAYITRMRAEHVRLRECLHLVERRWPLQHHRCHGTDVIPQLIDSLEALRAELSHHFEEEESGGCIEEAISHQPSLSNEATRLEHEHPELLGQIDRLIKSLRSLSRLGESTDDIEQEFRRFAEQLFAHESAEDRILAKSFGIEVE